MAEMHVLMQWPSLISCSVKSGEEVISEYISTWVEDDWIMHESII